MTGRRAVLGAVLSAVLAGIGALGGPAPLPSVLAQTTAGSTPPSDHYQRSADHFSFTASAKSGPQRGEELYFYKCWYCHNQFAKRAPYLQDLFKRPGTTDQAVADKIRKGGPGMPAYDATLNDADLADLLGYLKERCCWEGENPPPNPRYRAGSAQAGSRLLGGAHGAVRGQGGEPLEGVGVQLVSQRTSVRTTVYTNESGRFEFPPLEAGVYTLRVPRPLEFRPYVKESVRIDKAVALDEIRLERVSPTEFLPPTPDILAQLTGSEWMMNLPGSGEEKRLFTLGCGMGCHSYQQVFRNRYDERSWQLILQRMLRSGSSTLINDVVPTPETMSRAGRPMLEVEPFLAKWLGRVRGPDFEDPPLHYLPRERGRATRVIVTEYELPRELLAPHDVHGDAQGNIWYTAHRSAYSGVLDPRTGIVKEYRIPEKERDTPGFLPGTHRVWVHTDGMVWFWEAWDGSLTALDPRTGEITKRWDKVGATPEVPLGIGGPNFAMDEGGYIYQTYRGTVVKTDSRTGEIVKRFPLKQVQGTYDSIITPDGRYWAGGVGPTDSYQRLLGLLDTKTGEVWEPKTSEITSPSRGGFDAEGNAWFGGRGGMLLRIDAKTKRVDKYYPPIPFETYYEAMPDKNGEVWAGGLQSGRFWRFNPKTEQWTGYMMPEPYAHDRRTWIDNSTTPVTVWYVDHNGYMVRIQPLE